MSFLFPQIFAWLRQSLTEPFVWGCWGERGRQSVREREKKREEGGKGDTTATICSMWPSLFSIRAAIHGMVLLITAHNTFSGMAHNLPVARWTSRVTSGRVHVYICLYVCVRVREVCTDSLCKCTCHCMQACTYACIWICASFWMCVGFSVGFSFWGCVCAVCEGPVVRWSGWASRKASPTSGKLTGGVCRATAQVPRTSGWMSWRRVMGSHWAYDVKANLMPNC